MSYLDVPRLHFFGTFTANPSTRNNDPNNFGETPTQIFLGGTEGWNPQGSHSWTLGGCTVRTVIGPDGSPSQDPLVGTAVASAATPQSQTQCQVGLGGASTPKLVDLDPDNQQVSMIFGLQIQIGDSTSGTVTGSFLPQNFLDINGANPSAWYQSVLQDLTWSPNPTSPILQALQQASPDALSIKFVLLAPPFPTNPSSLTGTITGTIGPVSAGEPANFLLGRLLQPAQSPSTPSPNSHQPPPSQPGFQCNYTPFAVRGDRGKLIVDFGNTFPMSLASGSIQPQLGPAPAMTVAICSSQSATGPVEVLESLGPVVNTLDAYQSVAALQEFDLSAAQATLLQTSIVAVLDANGNPLLMEDSNATSFGVAPLVCRLNPGDPDQPLPGDLVHQTTINLVALSFGLPAANQTIGVSLPSALQQGLGTPADALQILDAFGSQPITSVTTDANGQASFLLRAAQGGPNNPRGTIDGQVYWVGFNWNLAQNLDPSMVVSVRVFDAHPVPESPDWNTDVSPILQLYFDLYPFMSKFFDLSDPVQVAKFGDYISCRMQLPQTDPRYMPVTRDLSGCKIQTILNWLAQQPQGEQGGPTAEGTGGVP
jgi:hypothetical protein